MNRSAEETAAEVKATLARLEELVQRLEQKYGEVERQRERLMDKANELERIINRVLSAEDNRGWRRFFWWLGTVLVSSACAATIVLSVVWLARHGRLPWW